MPAKGLRTRPPISQFGDLPASSTGGVAIMRPKGALFGPPFNWVIAAVNIFQQSTTSTTGSL